LSPKRQICSTRIGQTHTDISGTIIGQAQFDQFALQLVKRTTTLAERSLVKGSTTLLRHTCSNHQAPAGPEDGVRHRCRGRIETLNWECWFQFRNSLQRNADNFGVHPLLHRECVQLIAHAEGVRRRCGSSVRPFSVFRPWEARRG